MSIDWNKESSWNIIKSLVVTFFKRFKPTEKTFFGTFLLFFIPFFIFITIDLWTTYIGACLMGGYEVNSTAVMLGSIFGYIITGLLVYGAYALMNLAITSSYRKSKTMIYKVLIIVVWAFAVSNYASVILSNSDNAFHLATGHDLLPSGTRQQVQSNAFPETSEQLNNSVQLFKDKGEKFCRLIP